MIWTDRDERRSRANLNTALWRINRILKTIGSDDIRLHVSGDQLKMAVAPSVFIDVLAVEAAVKDAVQSCRGKVPLPLAGRDTLIDVLSGDGACFLEGLSSEWVLIERERVFNLQIRGLTLLMQDFAARGQIEEALEYGRCILRMDPMRECIHRLVMWLHVLNGHQANAAASWKVNSTTGSGPPSESVRRSTRVMRAPASSGPRIISSTQRIFCPTTTVEMPSSVVVVWTTCVGHALPSSIATRCTGPVPGSGTLIVPLRSCAALLTTMVDDGGTSISVASARAASRVSASPTWRASW